MVLRAVGGLWLVPMEGGPATALIQYPCSEPTGYPLGVALGADDFF